MDAKELLAQVRRIEIKTKALSGNIFAGEYHSAFKGRGMSFAEVREYQIGDDVRDIDWNVTARTARPHLKVFEEERELSVMLLIDVSGSLDFGSTKTTQRQLLTEVAATLAFSAIGNNDRIGVIFFSDRIERFIPPSKGRKHILRIIRELLELQPASRGTDVGVAIEYLMRVERKRCIAFLMSDFVGCGDFFRLAGMAARRHDLVVLRLSDCRMRELPDVGLVQLEDAETGEVRLIDTSVKSVREIYARKWRENDEKLRQQLRKQGIDMGELETGKDFVRVLVDLFRRRI
ncbi:MAG: DUF58 domain-containing protein [Prevotellaceae bacterium]|nr:DUF58 domain-containing protein [Prevotellaceae bacterium]